MRMNLSWRSSQVEPMARDKDRQKEREKQRENGPCFRIHINKCHMQTHVQEFTHPVLEKELPLLQSCMKYYLPGAHINNIFSNMNVDTSNMSISFHHLAFCGGRNGYERRNSRNSINNNNNRGYIHTSHLFKR